MLTPSYTRAVVRRALAEDAPWGDLTALHAIPADVDLAAHLVAREPGVFAGGTVIVEAFRQSDERIEVTELVPEGHRFAAGETLARVNGPAQGVLTAERVALNFAQRMSGIATLTAAFVERVSGTRARIADTRKTTPGLRMLEKHAVRAGGGVNHRFSLSDAVMVKDNHLAALGVGIDAGAEVDAAALTAALVALRARLGHTVSVIVEVDRLEQIEPVLAARVTGVLIDNFSLDDLREAVRIIGDRAVSEASGGVTLDTVRDIASTGVEVISVGQLTHGARALDLGLDAA